MLAGQETMHGPPQPARIRAARDLRQLTQAATVKRMQTPISTAALSQIEAGKVRPTDDTIEQLAEALTVPLGFFSAQWPDTSSGDILSKVTYFRDLAATPAGQRRKAAALSLLLSDLIAAIEVRVLLPELYLPKYQPDTSNGRQEIDEIAEAVRDEWNLGDGPIPHVVKAIESHGVPIARLAMGGTAVDAFSVRFGRRPLILLTNDKSNYVRSRFDASHELGHLIMHHHHDPNDRSIERQAHDFASSFLLPTSAAMEELPSRLDGRAWARLAEMKRVWGISIAALLYRARELGKLSPDTYRSGMKYMSMRGWRTTEPGDRELGPPEASALIYRALLTVTESTRETTEELITAAHLPLDDVLNLISASTDRRLRVTL